MVQGGHKRSSSDGVAVLSDAIHFVRVCVCVSARAISLRDPGSN